MTTMFRVQKDWPIPPIDRSPKTPRRKWPVATMDVGDMFFLPGKTVKAVSAYTVRVTKQLPGRFATRRCWAWQDKVGDWRECGEHLPGAVSGVGVWREE